MFGSDVDRRITDEPSSASSADSEPDDDDDRLDEVDRVAQKLPEVRGDD